MGTSSLKNGKFLPLTALTYIDLLKMPPTANDTKSAKMIYKKRLTFSVVSSIMIASEKNILFLEVSGKYSRSSDYCVG